MARIVLNIEDEKKAELLLTLLSDLSYVDAQSDTDEIVWGGYLPVFDNPIHLQDFRMYSREELYDR